MAQGHNCHCFSGEQGWRSGESACLYIAQIRLPDPASYVGYSPGSTVFHPAQKPTVLSSSLIWKQWT